MRRSLLLLALLVITITMGIFYSWFQRKEDVLLAHLKIGKTSYQTVSYMYQRIAETLYDEVVVRPDILRLMSGASKASRDQQAIIRGRLYKRLYPAYRRLQKRNLKQLHFHLADNTSFIRFHRLDKYGDSLTAARESIRLVNKYHKPVFGFENGKVFNGFRFVFPLTYEGQHVGSVETSVSFLAIQEALTKASPEHKFLFILKREKVEAKAFAFEKSIYQPVLLHPQYMVEDLRMLGLDVAAPVSDQILRLNRKLGANNQIRQNLDGAKGFAVMLHDKGKNYIVTFLPVTNIKGEQVAYIVSYEPDYELANLFKVYLSILLGVFFVSIIIIFFLWKKSKSDRDLLMAQKNAEAANRAKSQFLANMSHEIRTPMNSIIGRTILALDASPEAEIKSHLEMVLSSGENLLALINDILDFSKIEAGELTITNEPFYLQENIVSSINSINVLVEGEEKDIELNYNIEPDVPAVIKGDALRFRQILLNLLSNAVKFTDRGQIDVAVKRVENSELPVLLQFKVQDTGIGIEADKLDYIFSEFAQEDDTITRMYGGTGLGLAICRKLCNLMGGEIIVHSMPGSGSTFICTIPFQPCSDNELPVKVVSDVLGLNSPLSSLKILIVDDNEANRQLARMILEKDDHQVMEAENGLEALKILTDNQFDAVFMDVQMPEMDGYSATRIIRIFEQGETTDDELDPKLAKQLGNRLKGGHLPIISMTALAMSGDRNKCFAVGMDEYISKPFKPAQITEVLHKITSM